MNTEGKTIARQAHSYSETAAASPEFQAELSALVQKGEDVKTGPYHLCLRLMALYDTKMNDFPPVGVKQKEKIVENGVERTISRNDYDVYYVPVGDKEVRRSFYEDFADETSEGKRITSELDALNKKIADGKNEKLVTDKQRWTQRRNSLYNYIRNTFKLYQKVKAIGELPGLEATLRFDDKTGKALDTTFPVEIWPTGKDKEYVHCQIPQVTRMKPEIVVETARKDNLTMLEALQRTARSDREGKKGTGKTAASTPVPPLTVDKMEEVVAEIATFSEDSMKRAGMLANIASMKKDPAKHQDYFLSLGETCRFFGEHVWPKIEDAYLAAVEADSKAKDAERAAKKAA